MNFNKKNNRKFTKKKKRSLLFSDNQSRKSHKSSLIFERIIKKEKIEF